jgi:hypothetical protein
MPMTMAEAAQHNGQSPLEQGVIKMFAMESPILELLPFRKIEGDSITYRTEGTLPGIAWRAVNQTYTESTGTLNPTTERLFILGGEVKLDNFIVHTQGKGRNGIDVKAQQYAMKVQAASNAFDQAFFEGDDLVDVNSMVGLRRRLTGNQVILAGAGGAALTLSMLDQLLDKVPFGNVHLFMNRTMRRKVTALIRAESGSTMISTTIDTFGRQIRTYNEVPIHVVERQGDGSSILDFDEDPGDGVADTSSVYAVSFGLDRVHGIYNGPDGKMLQVHDFGEIQAAPQHLGRIEFYPGMAVKHGRAAARLRGVLNV